MTSQSNQPGNSGQSDDKLIRRLIAGALVFVPWSIWAITAIASPQYMGSFVGTPAGMAIAFFCVLLSAVAWWGMQSTRNVVVWIAIFLLLVIPQSLVPMLAPAAITIFQALGPVMGDK